MHHSESPVLLRHLQKIVESLLEDLRPAVVEEGMVGAFVPDELDVHAGVAQLLLQRADLLPSVRVILGGELAVGFWP